MKKEFIAHVKQNADGSWADPHYLEDHLNATAKKAGEFAASFGNQDWGELLGYWHDIGKFLPSWQIYLQRKTGYDKDAHIENSSGRPNHSTAGAILAFECAEKFPPEARKIARLIAYGIAGHHAGLPDWYPDDAGGDLQNRVFTSQFGGTLDTLDTSEIDKIKQIPEAKEFLEKKFPKSIPLGITKLGDFETKKEHFHLWVRMLFSCLVDADFLDTEKYMARDKADDRGDYLSLKELKTRFDTFMETKIADTPINKKRNEILEQCRKKANYPSGFFSLNVPTGGGKTLSSMAFALEHALKHDKKRIIVAIPYTSIIEQTAKVFKYGTDDEKETQERLKTGNVLFGEDQVIEHHSNLDPEKEDSTNRLASENWDAPIIVTTNVQLFESLFASRTSACRKLHNISNSVIILDEAQMLPPEHLKPVLSVLRGLVEHFGVTVVLMTATQPALEGRIGSAPNDFDGITNIAHIIDDPEALAKDFQRIEISLPPDLSVRSEWDAIALELQKHEQVLCIVNTRTDCRKLHGLMPAGTIHLSAFMCGEERSEVISSIKIKLRNSEPIRVISTQLVEAGVDIDFPVVYRALAGLDSIAQAAGRCNRENKLAEQGKHGKVIVFNPPKSAPVGMLRKGEDACKTIIRTQYVLELTPTLFTEYFHHFYVSLNGFDAPRFQERLVEEADEFIFQFRTLAYDFHMIDDAAQRSIVIWYENKNTGNNSEEWIKRLRFAGPSKLINRRLQRFIVNVPKNMFDGILANKYIEEIHGYWVQSDPVLYKPGLGLLGHESDWVYGYGVV